MPPGTTDEGIHYVLDNLVLPVLEEFEPDLVVNSAGQDNHYTDPLASMQFTTQGYATLNEKLAPDIAVLEGGYSVETALPYVNMGIIMAMAGIDYSNLYEPDYKKSDFKEDRKRLKILEEIIDQLLEVFSQRKSVQATYREDIGSYYQRQRNIFHDTIGLREKQIETIKICGDCPGYLTIETLGQFKAFCIDVPIQGCATCRQEAMEEYEETSKKGSIDYHYLYLKDRVADSYFQYDFKKQKEIKII